MYILNKPKYLFIRLNKPEISKAWATAHAYNLNGIGHNLPLLIQTKAKILML
ncbi:phosphoribosylanthranilate isomerase [Neisseria wadsworthii 9715]|uniref:Phosphoribosylanthranilate isomerase n=1 Tax=Neisseria wadsworthii 9715 TaxID=1030841 RepID=G4CSY0_9NEIS|nr:phosphoribosylanthranilate isomerase [Neisseria wadsworthii 9715]